MTNNKNSGICDNLVLEKLIVNINTIENLKVLAIIYKMLEIFIMKLYTC